MTQEKASELITENLTAIYGYAYGRLYEKDKVEDLASEIVCDCMLQISEQAEKLLTEHAPAAVRSQCGDVAKIHHRLDVAAFLQCHLPDFPKHPARLPKNPYKLLRHHRTFLV